jgi:hypothetical protein
MLVRVYIYIYKIRENSHSVSFFFCGRTTTDLEAFSVDNAWTRLVILSLGDPHGLKGGERGQDGASDPHRVLPLRRSDDLDLHGARRQSGDLLLHAVGNARVHGGATRQHIVGVQVLSDVDVALHDRRVGGLVQARYLHAEEGRLEEGLGRPESLVANGNDLTVWQLVGLLQR